MDYVKPEAEPIDLDSMDEAQLKKELSKRATLVKPYLKMAKEIGVDINHAKKLVARAVTESKQNEFKVAILLMDEGIEFAENEFRRKIREDLDNLAIVIRDFKMKGIDVTHPASLITQANQLLEDGNIAESTEKLKSCLEEIERLAN
jgi:hypothetical protein